MSNGGFPPGRTARPTRVRFLVLALIASAAASAYLTRHCVAAANTTIQTDLELNDTRFGYVFSAFAWGYLLFQVPGGWLGQRYGTRAALAWSSVAWSLLTLWTASATGFVPLLVSRFCFGLAQGGLAPLAGQVIREWIPENRRGLSSAFVSGAMSVGGAGALFLTGWLLERNGGGWRPIFVAWSVVGVVWAVVFATLFRTRPDQHPWVNAAEVALIRPPATTPESEPHSPQPGCDGPGGADSEPPSRGAIARRMATSVALWALCVQSFFRAAGYSFYVSWLFAYLEYAWKTPKDQAGWLTNLPLFANVGGALFGGVLVDWLLHVTGSRWISRSGAAAGSLFLCMLATWAAASATSAGQLAAILALGAFFAGVSNPAIWAATIDVGGSQTGVTLGVMNMAGCLGDALVPLLVGGMIATIKATGGQWTSIIHLHVAIYAAAAVACLAIRPDRPVAPDH